MANKQIRDTYNDGFLKYGTKTTQRDAQGRRSADATFNQLGVLAFSEMSCREDDYKMAQAMTKVLNLKVKTPYPVHFENHKRTSLIVRIGNYEFDVIKVDADRKKSALFFYLQEVGAVE